MNPGVVALTCNLSTCKAEDLEFKASLGYTARPCLKKRQRKKKEEEMSQ
jgi:hypothetical protein